MIVLGDVVQAADAIDDGDQPPSRIETKSLFRRAACSTTALNDASRLARPPMQRFSQLLREQPLFADAFGPV